MNIKKEDVILFFRQNVKSIILAFVCSLVLIIAGLFYYNQSKTEDYSGVSFSNANGNEVINKDEKAEDKHDEKIFVDVKGAVKHPGVFETTKDKRVKDLIEEAGGLLDNADTSTLNLSQKVKDQMVIYVLKHGEKPKQISDGSTSSTNGDVININTANKEQLMKISGVGKTKAEAIISYREKNGDFKKKEDITKVHGIGKATFEKIKDKIEV